MMALLIVSLVLLVLQLLFVCYNLRHFPFLQSQFSKDSAHPSISVLIPARDEEGRIGHLLQSLTNQTVQPEEILVLDDHSADGTAGAVRAWKQRLPSLKLLKGKELEAGWLGKSFACHQLAYKAQGSWFLFLDADTALEPDAIAAVRSEAERMKRGMISGFPKTLCTSWLEKLVVPMMPFTIACHLPLRFAARAKDPKFAAACGGFILIERDTYFTSGGHEAIRSSLLDDMDLARQVKKKGMPMRLLRIHPFVSVRMYEGNKEVWNGYRKNIFPGINRSWLLFTFLSFFYSLLYLLPPAAAAAGLMNGSMPLFLSGAAGYVTGVLIKWLTDRSNGLSGSYAPFIPFSIFFLLAIAADSMRTGFSSKGYEWKGRRYT